MKNSIAVVSSKTKISIGSNIIWAFKQPNFVRLLKVKFNFDLSPDTYLILQLDSENIWFSISL